MPEPIYHVLAANWRVPNSAHAGTARELGEAPPRLAALPLVSEPLGAALKAGAHGRRSAAGTSADADGEPPQAPSHLNDLVRNAWSIGPGRSPCATIRFRQSQPRTLSRARRAGARLMNDNRHSRGALA